MVEAGVPLRVITSAALPVKAAKSTPPAARAVAARRREPERLDGMRGDGDLAGTGIAEQPEHLLLAGADRDTSRRSLRWPRPAAVMA